MNNLKIYIILSIFTICLLSACSDQPLDTPASIPNNEPVLATQGETKPAPSVDAILPTDTATADASAPITVSFANDILPLLESRCVNCHGGEKIQEGLILKTYADIMAGSDNGPVIVPGDSENSLFVELVVNKKMPKKGPKLTPAQVQLITEWVKQGALNN